MNRVIMPLLIPVTAVAIVAVIVFSLSRLLIAVGPLTFSGDLKMTPPVALGVALIILLVCSWLSSRTEQA